MRKLLAVTLLSLASSAHAAQGFIGAGLGMSTVSDFTEQEFMMAADDGSLYAVDADDSDSAFKIFGGVQVTPNFAIEAAYANLGEYTVSAQSNGGGFFYAAGSVDYSAEASAISLAAKVMAPVNPSFGVHAKLGFARWESETDFTNNGFGVSISDDGTDAYFALGASVNATTNVSIQLEFEHYADVTDSDIDVIGLSVAYLIP